jgi:hypothetical protein
MYMLPLHFMFAILLPLNKFLQCQRKNWAIALSSVLGFPVHVVATWLLVQCFQLGVLGAAMSLNLSWALITGLQLAYAIGGGCPETWRGFSWSAFMGLKDFVRLSVASGVMTWYVLATLPSLVLAFFVFQSLRNLWVFMCSSWVILNAPLTRSSSISGDMEDLDGILNLLLSTRKKLLPGPWLKTTKKLPMQK